MAGITIETLVFVWLGAFLGAFAAGGAGFAFALTAAAIWLHVLDPLHTTMLVVACGTILHVGLIWPMRHVINKQRLWPFLAGGLIGIPIGVHLLARTDPHAIKIALGVFLTAYGIFALAVRRLPYVKGGRVADAVVGLAGGILGGIGGYSGVLPTIWTQLRGWSKETARGVYQPFILAAHIATLVLVGAVALDRSGLILIAAALPPLLAGAGLGWHLYGRLDERRFRQMLSALLVASGATLVF